MQAIAILGSRDTAGKTARCTEAMLEGVRQAGGETSTVYLPHLDIERCRQCDNNGWGLCRREGRCVIEDDFADVVAQLRAADAAVFANPVYYGDLSESMRAFTDRLRRIGTGTGGKEGLSDKPTVGVCVAGGGGGGAPSCCASLEKVLRTVDLDVVDLVPVRRQNMTLKADVLRRTGAWLAALPSSSGEF